MSECLGCQRLEDENAQMVELVTGQRVCTYCPEWMLETEAKALLAMGLKERQRLLLAFEAKRGEKSVTLLKQRMILLFERQKSVAKASTNMSKLT